MGHADRIGEGPMYDTLHHPRGARSATETEQELSLPEVWRSFFLDLPLSLASLPHTLSTDCARFASHRLSAQARHLEDLCRCQSVGDALKLQMSFAATALADYQKEAEILLSEARDAVTADYAPV